MSWYGALGLDPFGVHTKTSRIFENTDITYQPADGGPATQINGVVQSQRRGIDQLIETHAGVETEQRIELLRADGYRVEQFSVRAGGSDFGRVSLSGRTCTIRGLSANQTYVFLWIDEGRES